MSNMQGQNRKSWGKHYKQKCINSQNQNWMTGAKKPSEASRLEKSHPWIFHVHRNNFSVFKKGDVANLSHVYFPWLMWKPEATEAAIPSSNLFYRLELSNRQSLPACHNSPPPIERLESTSTGRFTTIKPSCLQQGHLLLYVHCLISAFICHHTLLSWVHFPLGLQCSHVLLATVRRPGRAT